ncbi:hypothetical protein A2368_00900 [Candidatus Collierbacteria bacterium RIFOXYB1_FULL_49_13]|uniref:VWFA domain-containing protein n=1 Tax=Candidatus Collierbacteria bacterium RIFOXYB1_FULL_49_13 TaxID=1817728 RepID=A0A1F5FHI4_9BACT|nr:MAG: hypothetical protein A2368_00900 [Candidatus Collierbacteria bacterium RIFOXYB1_FULL_49_13]
MFTLVSHWYQPVIRQRAQAIAQGEVHIDVAALTAASQVPDDEKGGAIILDISSSMTGIGLTNLKIAAKQALEDLPDGTKVTIITFSGYSDFGSDGHAIFQSLAQDTVLTPSSRIELAKEIDKLQAGGYTRFFEPTFSGIHWLSQLGEMAKVVILCTDGEPTVPFVNPGSWSKFFRDLGTTVIPQEEDNDLMLQLCAQLLGLGAPLFAYGMGTAYQEDILTAWVEAAGGESRLFHVTSGGAGLNAAMQQSIARLAKAVAHKVEIAFVAAAGVEIVDIFAMVPAPRHVGNIDPALAVDKVGMVNSAEGAPYQVVFRFLGTPPLAQSVPVATIKVTYYVGTQQFTEEFPLTIDVTNDQDLVASRQDDSVAVTLTKTQSLLGADQALRDLTAARTRGDQDAIDRATAAFTRSKTMAAATNDPALSALLSGMASGDPDIARDSLSRARSMHVDLDKLLDGLEAEDDD